MPPIEVICANPDCGEKFQVGSEMAGELVECPKCGASVYVLEPDSLEVEAPAELGKGKGKTEKAHIAHPARLTCPNCGAVLGVRDAFCPDCGADIRTGAAVMTKVERKKLNLGPFLIVGGILLGLAALVVLVIFALRLMSQHAEEARLAREAAAKAAVEPVAKAAAPVQDIKPKLAYEVPKQVLASLADRELKTSQTVDAYLEQLKQTLSAVRTADRDQMAARWADLYQYCQDKGLLAEAEQAWYQAARLGTKDAAVNQKLGLSDSYGGVAVSPAQKQFLMALKPGLKVVNRDVALRDCVVVIKGLDPVAIPLGKVVELQPAAGPVLLTVARAATPERPLQEFALTAEPGIEQTMEIYSPYAAPSLPRDVLEAIYSAISQSQDIAGVTIKRDSAGKVAEASAGDIRVVGTPDAPVEMWVTRTNDQLAIIGSIPVGNRFQAEGSRLFNGTRLHPISLAVTPDPTIPLRLSAGGYCVLHADLTDGLWGMLGTVNGDAGYEFVRSRVEKRIDEVAFENVGLEARGELSGPWQTRVRLYDETSARRDALESATAERRGAAALPIWRDRARLLGLSEGTDSIYLNWPRFRGALAVAMKGAGDGIAERLTQIGQSAATRAAALPTSPGMPGAPAFVPIQTPAVVDRDTITLRPSLVPMNDEARTYALMCALPLLPDDAALQKAQTMWPQLNPQQRLAALMAMEQVATPEAIAWLGQVAQTSTDSDVTAMALLSLGGIGTPEALTQTEMPGVSAKVRTASLVAGVVAGRPDAIDQVPNFLAGANPDESAAFLQYVTQFDTPGALLALSRAADAYKDQKSVAQIAAALSRMGGKAATRELSRLMEKSSLIFADKLGKVQGEDALMLVRQVGAAVAGQKSPDAGALHVLVADGSDASIAFLLAAAINQNNTAAVEALARMGTAPALDAAGQAAKAVTLQMLGDLRKRWSTSGPKGGPWAWAPGVDAGGAAKFLQKVFADNADPKVRIAAATLLQEAASPLSSAQLLAFARDAAGAAPAGKFSPAGFEWPAGRPVVPQGFQFDGSPTFYAVGLALQSKDASLGAGLQALFGDAKSGSLKAAAAAALGRLGGEGNLGFLRAAAAKSKGTYADAAELAKELQDRLAALAGLAESQDATFLPRALDMLKESPPAASAVPKTDNYAEVADWWQIELWRGACDCVAGISRQRSPLELAADSGLQSMLTDRLKALIDEPGPKRESLSAARQELRAAAIRAFGRVADFNDTANSFIFSRLVVDLTQRDSGRAAAPGVPGSPGSPGVPGQPQPASFQADSLRIALLDAVAHAGSRVQDLTEFVGYVRTLTSSPSMKKAWDEVVRAMADEPTPGYFALLTAVSDTVDSQTGIAVYDASKDAADAKGRQYGTFLASLLGATGAQAPITQPVARAGMPAQPVPEPTVAPPVTSGPTLTPEQIAALEAENRAAGMAAARAMMESMQGPPMVGPPGVPGTVQGPVQPAASGVIPEYDRRLPYKRMDWQYRLDEAAKQVAELRQKWAIVQTLIESSGSALPGVAQAANLLTGCDLGPAAAPSLVKQDASLQDGVVKQLAGILAPAAPEPAQPGGPASPGAMPSMDARRAAVDALRQISSQPAADALYNGLAGPVSAPQSAAMAGMAAAMVGPLPDYALRAMQAARSASADPVPVFIARALGSMGREDLLRSALNAQDRRYFQNDAVAVQSAALSGMAYLPAANDPVNALATLVRAVTAEALRKAAVDALVTAAQLAGRQG